MEAIRCGNCDSADGSTRIITLLPCPCGSVYYCDRECQKQHKEFHKPHCTFVGGSSCSNSTKTKQEVNSLNSQIENLKLKAATAVKNKKDAEAALRATQTENDPTYIPIPTFKSRSCDSTSCSLDSKLRCSRCGCASYCSPQHQKTSWAAHKKFCNKMVESEVGYPNEKVSSIYDDDSVPLLASLTAKPDAKLDKKFMSKKMNSVLFPFVREYAIKKKVPAVVATKAIFKEQLSAVALSIFDDWDAKMWENVFVAGGAVLNALLPVPSELEQRVLKITRVDFNFLSPSIAYGYPDDHSYLPRNKENFLANERWPAGDVDVFIYGLSERKAEEKLKAIAVSLRNTFKRRDPMITCLFVRTTNTLTLDAGKNLRAVQVITRLYKNPESIINSFDVDCCCLGFDGSRVLINERGSKALLTRLNTLNLNIRSDSTENRLLKYAARGFGIYIPQLLKNKIDRENAAKDLVPQKCDWGGGATLSGEGWGQITKSKYLSRILSVFTASQGFGGIMPNGAFESRKAAQVNAPEENVWRYKINDNPTGGGGNRGLDLYPGISSKGVATWPATTKLEMIANNHDFRISWQVGQMARKPMTWEEVSERSERVMMKRI